MLYEKENEWNWEKKGNCCRASGRTTGLVENRTLSLVLALPLWDVGYPFVDGTRVNIKRAGGEHARNRFEFERMAKWKPAAKSNWAWFIGFSSQTKVKQLLSDNCSMCEKAVPNASLQPFVVSSFDISMLTEIGGRKWRKTSLHWEFRKTLSRRGGIGDILDIYW